MIRSTDIEELNAIIDNSSTQTYEEISKLLHSIQKRLYNEHKNYYLPLLKDLERKVEEQALANQTIVQRSSRVDSEIEKIKYFINRLVDHISVFATKDRISNDRSLIFRAWRDYATCKNIYTNTFMRIYLDEPMKRLLFKRWLRKMRKIRYIRQKRELKRLCTRNIKAHETEAVQKITALQSELTAVKELLAEHEKQHGEMQKRLRRAFMRGVVNLNLEAIDVFGDVSPEEVLPVVNATKKGGQVPKQPVSYKPDSDDDDDYYVEPAPRISIIRHK